MPELDRTLGLVAREVSPTEVLTKENDKASVTAFRFLHYCVG